MRSSLDAGRSPLRVRFRVATSAREPLGLGHGVRIGFILESLTLFLFVMPVDVPGADFEEGLPFRQAGLDTTLGLEAVRFRRALGYEPSMGRAGLRFCRNASGRTARTGGVWKSGSLAVSGCVPGSGTLALLGVSHLVYL